MKKLMRFLLKSILVFILFIAGYFLLASILSWTTTSPDEISGPKNKSIYISTNGVHADVVLPVELINGHNLSQLNRKGEATFVGFGWGDKGFYLETPTWGELKASTAIKALFMKSETAMHVTYHSKQRPDWTKISLSEEQVDLMLQFIQYSFDISPGGYQLIPDASYSDKDEFYEALGNYSCIKTCNSWANQALKAGQIKTAKWAPFDWCILRNFE